MLCSNVRDRIGYGGSSSSNIINISITITIISSSKNKFINNVGELADEMQNQTNKRQEVLFFVPSCVQATMEGVANI